MGWHKRFDKEFLNRDYTGCLTDDIKAFIAEELKRAREEGWQTGHAQTKEDYLDKIDTLIVKRMKDYVNTRIKDRKNAFDEFYKLRVDLDTLKTKGGK